MWNLFYSKPVGFSVILFELPKFVQVSMWYFYNFKLLLVWTSFYRSIVDMSTFIPRS